MVLDRKLFFQAILKFLLGFVLVAGLLFLPAWSLAFWQAWLFLGILFVPMFFAGIAMLLKSPDLLRKRLNARRLFFSADLCFWRRLSSRG